MNSSMPGAKFYIDRDRIWGDTFDIHFTYLDRQNNVVIAEPVLTKIIGEPELGVAHLPMLTVHKDAAQQLMDELWRAGFRPTEGTGSAGALAAVQKHLEDMRTITFAKLGIKS